MFASRLEAKANAQLKRCSNTNIRLNIEMRCARRQNDAAYQRHRRRFALGRHDYYPSASHAVPTLSGHVPYDLDCKTCAHGYMNRDGMRMPETEEFRQLRPRRATLFSKFKLFGLSEPQI